MNGECVGDYHIIGALPRRDTYLVFVWYQAKWQFDAERNPFESTGNRLSEFPTSNHYSGFKIIISEAAHRGV